ncbi:MAG TPA: EamA family transporter RarD [Tepidisphaeraceae bacterium]|jgi:chloramphenicol-sensitive protein RarD
MNPAASREKTIGLIAGVSAYLIWGFVAAYFRMLTDRGVAPLPLLAHRVIWSTLFCVFLLIVTQQLRGAWGVVRDHKRVLALMASSIMIAINWLAFIYSVEIHQLQQSALGYFMNPLVSVLLAMIFLGERLRRWQWVSLALAAIGVAIIMWGRGQVPWIGFIVAITFGFYGLLRKQIAVRPVIGLTIETALLLPLAAAYLILVPPDLSRPDWSLGTYGLLSLAGVVTAIPLLLFATAAGRLQLSTLGFLQYLAPTCQFLLATLYYGEAVAMIDLIGFTGIWAALIVYSIDAARRRPVASAIVIAELPVPDPLPTPPAPTKIRPPGL